MQPAQSRNLLKTGTQLKKKYLTPLEIKWKMLMWFCLYKY